MKNLLLTICIGISFYSRAQTVNWQYYNVNDPNHAYYLNYKTVMYGIDTSTYNPIKIGVEKVGWQIENTIIENSNEGNCRSTWYVNNLPLSHSKANMPQTPASQHWNSNYHNIYGYFADLYQGGNLLYNNNDSYDGFEHQGNSYTIAFSPIEYELKMVRKEVDLVYQGTCESTFYPFRCGGDPCWIRKETDDFQVYKRDIEYNTIPVRYIKPPHFTQASYNYCAGTEVSLLNLLDAQEAYKVGYKSQSYRYVRGFKVNGVLQANGSAATYTIPAGGAVSATIEAIMEFDNTRISDPSLPYTTSTIINRTTVPDLDMNNSFLESKHIKPSSTYPYNGTNIPTYYICSNEIPIDLDSLTLPAGGTWTLPNGEFNNNFAILNTNTTNNILSQIPLASTEASRFYVLHYEKSAGSCPQVKDIAIQVQKRKASVVDRSLIDTVFCKEVSIQDTLFMNTVLVNNALSFHYQNGMGLIRQQHFYGTAFDSLFIYFPNFTFRATKNPYLVPANLPEGTLYHVKYMWDDNSCYYNEDITFRRLNVPTAPVVTIADNTICSQSNAYCLAALSTTSQPYTNPVNYTWKYSNLHNPSTILGTNTGSNWVQAVADTSIVTLSYTNTLGCKSTEAKDTIYTQIPLPADSIFLTPSWNVKDDTIQLCRQIGTGQGSNQLGTYLANYTGGVWSGFYQTNGLFDPSLPIPSYATVNYTYTSPEYACTTVKPITVTLNTPINPIVNLFSDSVYCYTEKWVNLPNYTLYAGGTWQALSSYTIDSMDRIYLPNISVGSFAAKYTYADRGCITQQRKNFVRKEALASPIITTDTKVCEQTAITASSSGATSLAIYHWLVDTLHTTGGLYTQNVSDTTILQTYYIDAYDCISDTVSATIYTQAALPSDSILYKSLWNVHADTIELCRQSAIGQGVTDLSSYIVNYNGGTWSGNYQNNGIFDVIAPATNYNTVTYQYTSPDFACITNKSLIVSLNNAIHPIVNVFLDSIYCYNDTVLRLNDFTLYPNGTWQPNGNYSINNRQEVYWNTLSPATYSATYTYVDKGCINRQSKQFIRKPPVSNPILAAFNPISCYGFPVPIQVSQPNIDYTHQWYTNANLGNNLFGVGNSTIILAVADTSIYVTATDVYGCKSDATVGTFLVDKIEGTILVKGADSLERNHYNFNEHLRFKFVKTSDDNIVSYQWDMGNNYYNSTLTSPTYRYTPPLRITTDTTYRASVIITTVNGCIDTFYTNVKVNGYGNNNLAIQQKTPSVSILQLCSSTTTDDLCIRNNSLDILSGGMYTIEGKFVQKITIPAGENIYSVSSLASGYYYLKLENTAIKFFKN